MPERNMKDFVILEVRRIVPSYYEIKKRLRRCCCLQFFVQRWFFENYAKTIIIIVYCLKNYCCCKNVNIAKCGPVIWYRMTKSSWDFYRIATPKVDQWLMGKVPPVLSVQTPNFEPGSDVKKFHSRNIGNWGLFPCLYPTFLFFSLISDKTIPAKADTRKKNPPIDCHGTRLSMHARWRTNWIMRLFRCCKQYWNRSRNFFINASSAWLFTRGKKKRNIAWDDVVISGYPDHYHGVLRFSIYWFIYSFISMKMKKKLKQFMRKIILGNRIVDNDTVQRIPNNCSECLRIR